MELSILGLSSEEVYEKVARGEIPSFPNYFWNKEVAIELLRYVVITKMKMSKEDICRLDLRQFLKDVKLVTARKQFEDDYQMINAAFEELEIMPWELRKVKNNFWKSRENRLKALLWLAKKEEINLENVSEVRVKITSKLVYNYFGNKAIKYSNGSLFEFLDLYYEGRYKEWELLSKVGHWNDEKVKEAVRYMAGKMKLDTKEDLASVKVEDFKKFGLDGMLSKACRHSPLIAMQIAYPEMNFTNNDILSKF
ncbi:MAG: DUF4046 domain-containing protein [Clostridia bacterium]|nr:DUF4046 domain-containing protein [Clostridia bacterium]